MSTETPERPWWADPLPLVELFLVANVGFLGVDIAVAHAINAFAHPAEWVPVVFSVVATPVLILALVLGGLRPGPAAHGELGRPGSGRRRVARWLGLAVGYGSILVGVAGLILHLRSDFFEDMTIKNLVYTAPFVAPLAYTGVGLVLVLNRTVRARTDDWARWVVLLAMGGFLGNFALSLADHAQNGFFHPAEWVSVIAAAVAVGVLTAAVAYPTDRVVIRLGFVVMAVQVLVGLLGFGLHILGNLQRPGTLMDQFLYGSPVFAPLLFADLAILGALGLWAQARLAAQGAPQGLESRPGVPSNAVRPA